VIQTTLAKMPLEEFERHKSALSAKRLEKPKKLSALAGKYWSDISAEQYHFDRGNGQKCDSCLDLNLASEFFCFADKVEVEQLKKFTKQQIIAFYKVVF
jgi:secreted Zn-dependent insulinase-like peptidase